MKRVLSLAVLSFGLAFIVCQCTPQGAQTAINDLDFVTEAACKILEDEVSSSFVTLLCDKIDSSGAVVGQQAVRVDRTNSVYLKLKAAPASSP